MMMSLQEAYKKHQETILYLIFGVLTTLVNFLAYYLLVSCNIHYSISNAIAIALSILFAYVTNKIYVFESVTHSIKDLIAEFLRFISSRLASSVFDMLSMLLLIDLLACNELLSKIITNVVVIVLNYILSKKFAFNQST